MLLGLSQPLQPISNLSKREARKRKQESLKLALQQGKKLPKATPSRTSTKKKLHGSGKIPQTPTPEKKQKTKEDTDAEKSDNDLSIDSQAIEDYKTWQNNYAGDEASDNNESPPPDNYVHTEKVLRSVIQTRSLSRLSTDYRRTEVERNRLANN